MNSFLLVTFHPKTERAEMATSSSYSDDIAKMDCDEASKHIIRMVREMNSNSLIDNTLTTSYKKKSSPFSWDCSDYVHTCPYRGLYPVRSQYDWTENEYWLNSLRGILYNGVTRNAGWKCCFKCNPKGLSAEEARKEIAARKILGYLRRKVPIIKFKRSTTVFANLHIRRGLPADVVGKCLKHI